MIIDVKPKDLGLPTEAYISVEEIHDVSESWILFKPWKCSTSAEFLGDLNLILIYIKSIFHWIDLPNEEHSVSVSEPLVI